MKSVRRSIAPLKLKSADFSSVDTIIFNKVRLVSVYTSSRIIRLDELNIKFDRAINSSKVSV